MRTITVSRLSHPKMFESLEVWDAGEHRIPDSISLEFRDEKRADKRVTQARVNEGERVVDMFDIGSWWDGDLSIPDASREKNWRGARHWLTCSPIDCWYVFHTRAMLKILGVDSHGKKRTRVERVSSHREGEV